MTEWHIILLVLGVANLALLLTGARKAEVRWDNIFALNAASVAVLWSVLEPLM